MDIASRWRQYWFRPAPLLDLAICRVIIVGFQLIHMMVVWASGHGLHEVAALPDFFYNPLPILRLLTLPWGWAGPTSLMGGPWLFRPPVWILDSIYGLSVLTGLLALVGYRTNVSLVGFALGTLFLQGFLYSFSDMHHAPNLMMLALVILAASPAGGALSVDDWRRRRTASSMSLDEGNPLGDTSAFARWPLLLIRWLFALIYLGCATRKLSDCGLSWMNGDTLQHYLVRDSFRKEMPLGFVLGQSYPLAWLLSWVTMLFEATFFLVLLVPAWAWLYLPVGVALHVGIYVTMRARFFSYIAIYAVFVPWTALLHAVAERLRQRDAAQLEVVYDGDCPLCIRSMAWFRYFDWLDRLRFSPLQTQWATLSASHPQLIREACEREMHVLLPDGSVQKGFFAFRAILRSLPALWPLLAVFYIPGAALVGPLLYQFVAARRPRVHCTMDACEVRSSSASR